MTVRRGAVPWTVAAVAGGLLAGCVSREVAPSNDGGIQRDLSGYRGGGAATGRRDDSAGGGTGAAVVPDPVHVAGKDDARDGGDPGGATTGEVPADPVLALLDRGLRIEGDRVRLVVPERFRGDVRAPAPGGTPPWEVTVRTLVVTSRDVRPDLVIAGDDLSMVAEGNVLLLRDTGGGTFYREGPFDTVLVKNEAILRK